MKDLILEIDSLYNEFKVQYEKFNGGNKTAGRRARKLSVEITKKLKAFRADSVDGGKD